MSKLIRFDEDHFGYLIETGVGFGVAREAVDIFEHAYPDKRLLVMQADEFIDLTGQYEIIPIPEEMKA